MEIEHEAGSLVELWINIKVTIDLHRHLAADGQSETVAFRQVSHLKERLEHVFALLLRDTTTGIRYQELMGMGATLLIVKPDIATLWCIERRIIQQVTQDMRNILLVNLGTEVGHT